MLALLQAAGLQPGMTTESILMWALLGALAIAGTAIGVLWSELKAKNAELKGIYDAEKARSDKSADSMSTLAGALDALSRKVGGLQ